MGVKIEDLRRACLQRHVLMTKHVQIRCEERRISIFDIRNCIMHGKIIRQYEDDKPYPSFLLLGIDIGEKFLHVVASYNDGYAHIVTAYHPDSETWNEDFTKKIGAEK